MSQITLTDGSWVHEQSWNKSEKGCGRWWKLQSTHMLQFTFSQFRCPWSIMQYTQTTALLHPPLTYTGSRSESHSPTSLLLIHLGVLLSLYRVWHQVHLFAEGGKNVLLCTARISLTCEQDCYIAASFETNPGSIYDSSARGKLETLSTHIPENGLVSKVRNIPYQVVEH